MENRSRSFFFNPSTMHQLRIFFACILFILLFCSDVSAEFISIGNLGVDNAEGSVSVGFNIVVNDIDPLLQALQDGGEYELICAGTLYHRRAGFWNTQLAESSYNCSLSANPIARECVVRDYRGSHTFEFSDLRTDLNRFWADLALSMGSWDMVERNRLYRVMLTFRIKRTNAPPWVSRSLFFVNWDLLPEVVYELEFDY
jgi:hypothetical protein